MPCIKQLAKQVQTLVVGITILVHNVMKNIFTIISVGTHVEFTRSYKYLYSS